MPDRPPTWRENLLAAVACLAGGLVIGVAYAVVAPPLAPYAPVAIGGWWFALLAFGCTAALGVGLGHRRPRAVLVGALAVSLLSSALYAALLALPALAPRAINIVGLVNYALTQAAVTFFLVAFIGFPGAIAGLLASYFWHDR